MKTNFFRSRKFKYGAAATAMTVLFVAVVILLNVIFTALCQHYLWYADMTGDELFTLSDSSRKYLADIDDDLFIYFCNDRDNVLANNNLLYIYRTAQMIEEQNPRIRVECHNVRVEKAFFEKFVSTSASAVTQNSVVLYNATTGESRVYAYNAFYIVDEDGSSVWAYNGEYKFISGILQLTSAEMPVVYFTVGHGEDVTEGLSYSVSDTEGASYPGAYALAVLFADAGFEVRTINLTAEEIDADARIIVIYHPVYDFLGADEAEDPSCNEIAKLDAFLTRGDNSLMVFGSYEHPAPFLTDAAGTPVSNLAEFLDEWGLAYDAGTQVRDYAHCRSVDGLTIQPRYGKDTLGSSIYADLTGLSSTPMTAIRNSMAVRLTRGSEFRRNNYDACVSSPVLDSYDGAELLRSGEPVGTGSYTLAAMTRSSRQVETSGSSGTYSPTYQYSYVMLFGSPTFASSGYLYSNVYANRDILFASMKAVGRDTVLASIDFKILEDDTLTVSTAQANRWTAAMTLALPAVLAIVGVFVCVRRKHS